MPTPLGTRVEWLHPNGPSEQETDPQGHNFMKTITWEDETLVSTFTCDTISDVVTTRRIEWRRGGDMLVQTTSWEDVSFTRRFQRVEEEEGGGDAALLK